MKLNKQRSIWRGKSLYYILTSLTTVLISTGCRFHEELILAPTSIIDEVSRNRIELPEPQAVKDTDIFTFNRAALWMSRKNSELELLRNSYKGAKELAATWAPLPNPSIEFGVNYGLRLEKEKRDYNPQPYVSVGFSIPLGPRLIRTNNLNEVMRLQALNNILVKHRNLYLELRRNYINYTTSKKRASEQQEILANLIRSKKTAKKLFDLGKIDTLGVNSINFEYNTVLVDEIDREIEVTEDEGALAETIGVSQSLFSDKTVAELPNIPSQIPTIKQLEKLLLKNNTSLSELEMEFKVADITYSLELSKQIPDLNLGTSYSKGIGEKKEQEISPSIGIEVPLFDRNQQAIIEAKKARSEILNSYKNRVTIILTRLESSIKRYHLVKKKLELVNSNLIPLSIKNIEIAKKALKQGAIEVLFYLEFEQAHRKLLINKINLNQSLWDTIIDIENLVGYPLCFFPEERSSMENLESKIITYEEIKEYKTEEVE